MYKLLNGMRILDLTRLLPGGYASQLLADLGAEILKVEDPWQGDYLRWMEPYLPGTKDSVLYWSLNRNKKSIKLNLKSPEGRKAFLSLLNNYDIVLEGFRPGVLDNLGLGYSELRNINPAVILCSISGYGQDGPYSQRSGHDINYMAMSGALGLSAQKGSAPALSALQVADIGGGGLMAVTGILTAYIARQRTGKGQYIDVSMLDGVVSWMTMLYAQQAAGDSALKCGEGTLNGGAVCYGVYETKDGRFMSLGALEPKFWRVFCQTVGCPYLENKQFTREPEVIAEIEKIFKTKTREEWTKLLQNQDVCCEPILELSEAQEHSQFKARELFISLQHPNGGAVKVVGVPLKFPEEEQLPDQIPPGLGEQTKEVLREAGLSEEEILSLES